MKRFPLLLLLIISISSCVKNQDEPAGSFLTGEGVFIINEGKFTGGNGSLSYYSYDSSKIYNDLFSKVNGRPLGDVPNSAEVNGDNVYIVVNYSGKIEVINKSTLKSVSSITGLISPRNISFVNNSKAYVTSMYSDSVIIISLTDNTISGYINLRRSSESIAVTGEKAFVANWVGGKEIMVINTLTDKVVDSIEVGIEPESIVIDKNNMLWVLCNGGWTRQNFAELTEINTITNGVVRRLEFPSKLDSPSCLRIDGKGEALYYLKNGVQKLDITASSLPSVPFIPETDHYFYKIGINPVNNDIFLTDALDYQQSGYLLYYKYDGTLVSSARAELIPGYMCFKAADK